MNTKLISGLFAASVVLGGCGTIEKQFTNEPELQEKTAVALGVNASEVTIANISSNVDSLEWQAVSGSDTYRCYYTTAVAVKSDVICNKRGETAESDTDSCNALTKAAGQC